MKALTIWQPWASLIAGGAKRYETRSWATQYRGPIAIHAAAKDPCKLPLFSMKAMERIVREEIDGGRCPAWAVMPTGMVIATAELVNVFHIISKSEIPKSINGTKLWETEGDPNVLIVLENGPIFGKRKRAIYYSHLGTTEKEIALGDWTPGRYAWELANVKMLQEPIPAKGKQGLWNFNTEDVKNGG